MPSALLVAAFALLALLGISPLAAAAFALMFGAANGLITITRGALPLALFGADGYGRMIGRISGFWLVMQSAAPLVMAFVAERASDAGGAGVCRGFAVVALACFAAIRRPADRERSVQAQPNNCVDVVLRGMAAVAGKLRAVEEALARRRVRRPSTIGLKRSMRLPDLDQPGDVILDEAQRRHHLGDPLAGEVLEIAGLEDLHHPVLDVVRQPLVVTALERGGERARGLVDLLGGLQDRLRRLLGAVDDGRQLAAGARGVRARSGRRPPTHPSPRGCVLTAA